MEGRADEAELMCKLGRCAVLRAQPLRHACCSQSRGKRVFPGAMLVQPLPLCRQPSRPIHNFRDRLQETELLFTVGEKHEKQQTQQPRELRALCSYTTSSDGEGQDVPLKIFPGQCPGHHLLRDARSFSSTDLPAPVAMELGSDPASANFEECRSGIFPNRMARGKARRQVQSQKSCKDNGMMLGVSFRTEWKGNAVGENRAPDAEQGECSAEHISPGAFPDHGTFLISTVRPSPLGKDLAQCWHAHCSLILHVLLLQGTKCCSDCWSLLYFGLLNIHRA
ncbi:hypothetical protein QYF61_007554 [Mycteria americana]|uniref:Uncharacterized protein n=1 Tax=Mycteria americana TaxID=33587 RepID=A0AAN7NCS2_MYCAM|nr:hypothetical protein QYF61_007554 [Mycteria americana]